MIIDGNNIFVDIYCVPKWTVGYVQWRDPDSNNISVESYCVCAWTAGGAKWHDPRW